MPARQPAPDLPEPDADRDRPADELTRQVHRALAHLHDPAYLQTLSLQPLVPLARSASASIRGSNLGRALQQSLLQAVDSLRPSPNAPSQARGSRLHDLLHYRYVEALEIDVVCDRLGVGRGEFFRDHRRALAAVVSVLSESWTVEAERERSREGLPRTEAVSLPRETVHKSSSAPGSNLPVQLTSFVGREREMAEVRRLLVLQREVLVEDLL